MLTPGVFITEFDVSEFCVKACEKTLSRIEWRNYYSNSFRKHNFQPLDKWYAPAGLSRPIIELITEYRNNSLYFLPEDLLNNK